MPKAADTITLINHIASKYAKKGFNYDDLISEGHLAYTNAIQSYNPSKGDLKPYIIACLENQAKNYMQKEVRSQAIFNQVEEESSSHISDPLRILLFKEVILNLSDEAKEVINIALDCPSELIRILKKRQKGACKLNKRHLTEFLRSKGWQFNAIQSVFNEIKQAF